MLAACRYIMASSVLGAFGIPFLDSFTFWSGEIASRRRWRRASSALETKRGRVSILRIIGFVTGVMLHTLEGASVMDIGLVRQPFDKYTHWTATGAIGAMDSLLITTEDFLLFVRRKTLPSSSGRSRLPKACTLGKRQLSTLPSQLLAFFPPPHFMLIDQFSPPRRCPCPVRLEEHVTEGSELRCPEARRQESSPPMLNTDDGLSGAAKVALFVNGTSTAKLPLPPTPIQAGAADIGALQSCQPAPPRPMSTGSPTVGQKQKIPMLLEQETEREQKERLERPTAAPIVEKLQHSNDTKILIAHTTNSFLTPLASIPNHIICSVDGVSGISSISGGAITAGITPPPTSTASTACSVGIDLSGTTTTIVPHQPSPVVGIQLLNACRRVQLPQHHLRVLERVLCSYCNWNDWDDDWDE
ncbi:hypothetical protein M378DRAFT_17151 [Amanita muscaria Koide BX008]|uniref:Uncharacterized protein n=1 Tax=Amanita muscaria (strain Koide BX008) TaxID=946122 RepID=A0A0C2WI82_AMAMK|nr:hypothetical protein M378DRAFT_17151 [Amanita muscaria Koide BX008]